MFENVRNLRMMGLFDATQGRSNSEKLAKSSESSQAWNERYPEI